MTERSFAPSNCERPQIKVVVHNDEGAFFLKGSINEQDIHLAIAPVPQNASIVNLIEKVNGQYPARYRKYYDERIVISHSKNFSLHDDLQPSQSQELGSQTEYAGQTENKEVAVQVLRESMISKPPHWHNGTEYYHRITGNLAVRIMNLRNGERSEEILSHENPLVKVPEGYIHQVKAINGLAISVLLCDFTKHEYHPELNLFD